MKIHMNSPRLSGRGKVIVKHDDGTSTLIENNNDLLNNFFAWLSTSDTWPDDSNVTMKVGDSSIPTNVAHANLASVITLTSGGWPVCSRQDDGVAHLEEGGSVIVATRTYTATFQGGQVDATITEFGLDFGGSTVAGNSDVNTRVLIRNSAGEPSPVVIASSDQLIIEYTLEMRVSAADRQESVAVARDGGNHNHVLTTRFGKLAPFSHYMGLTNGGLDTDEARRLLTTDQDMGGSTQAEQIVVDDVSLSSAFQHSNFDGYKEVTVVMEGETNNHVGGIKTMVIGDGNSPYKFEWSPALPKDANIKLSFKLGLTLTR